MSLRPSKRTSKLEEKPRDLMRNNQLSKHKISLFTVRPFFANFDPDTDSLTQLNPIKIWIQNTAVTHQTIPGVFHTKLLLSTVFKLRQK
jgi:hypothetical protein